KNRELRFPQFTPLHHCLVRITGKKMWPLPRRSSTFVKSTKKNQVKSRWYVPHLTTLEDRILLSMAPGPFAGFRHPINRIGELAVVNEAPAIPPIGPSGPARDLIFVDSAVANYQALLAGMPGQAGADSQVVVLDAAHDEIAQITDILRSY